MTIFFWSDKSSVNKYLFMKSNEFPVSNTFQKYIDQNKTFDQYYPSRRLNTIEILWIPKKNVLKEQVLASKSNPNWLAPLNTNKNLPTVNISHDHYTQTKRKEH